MWQGSLTDEDKLLLDRLDDFIFKAAEQYTPCFTHFLDERQAGIAAAHLSSRRHGDFSLWGGHEDAERNILCVYPTYAAAEKEDFPITALTFAFRQEDELSHRDFLGAIMNLRVKREYVGDILVGRGLAVLFTEEKISPLIINEISKIGRTGVKLHQGMPFGLPEHKGFEEIDVIVNSPRLDAIVSAITRLSREKSAQLIRMGAVSVASCPCEDISRKVEYGSRLSIRGYGRFVVEDSGRMTKKGRLHLLIKKYL